MSSSLRWKPEQKPRGSLSTAVKFALRKRTGGQLNDEIVLTAADIPYFEGLRDADVEGAEEVIKLIELHGKIFVWEQF